MTKFDDLLTSVLLNRLRRYALSLTHNREEAADLVQDTVAKSLVAYNKGKYQQDTNFDGWVFRILRNQFISGRRVGKNRAFVDIDAPLAGVDLYYRFKLTVSPAQEKGMEIRDFLRAFRMLSAEQREALILATVHGDDYEAIAKITNVRAGTVKSRISRGRALLRELQ